MQYRVNGQLIINEGSNRNFSVIADEDGDHPDWIELWNSGTKPIQLLQYSLTDNIALPKKWRLPAVTIGPNAYLKIFCSSKDRKPEAMFQPVLNTGAFSPVIGWNDHKFSQPFYWDGVSNLLINTCSYNDQGYTSNSIFNQTITSFPSTVFSCVDNSTACDFQNGEPSNIRPNIKINGVTIGNGTTNNTNTNYPAPYGNWYLSAKHQMLYLAEELRAVGLTTGWLNSLSFDVVSTDQNTTYSFFDIQMKLVVTNELSSSFQPLNNTMNLHANFSIGSSGETIYLFDTSVNLKSQLSINCININNSKGLSPDGSSNAVYFNAPTPEQSNNQSAIFYQYLQQPIFSKVSGAYSGSFSVSISNPNTIPSTIRYTVDGSEPNQNSSLYNEVLMIENSTVLKAKAFCDTVLPSPLKAASYLININHTTPVLSVITDYSNLYGSEGIFDNWDKDWEKPAYAEYFNTDRSLVFSQDAAIQIDGGAGGSRSQPQHSFRLELGNAVLGGGTVNYPLIPDKPTRKKYSKLYLRNGSNQYLTIPYKDACGVKVLSDETHNYYSAYRPVSVYINGEYFGLYELREKYDEEFFQEAENADSIEILSQSYWYGGMLRSVAGSVDSFYAARGAFQEINPTDNDFWEKADRYFDLEYYADYVIAEGFIQNIDWPYNNIKIYRSNKTGHRYRFAIQDVELALSPNGWTNSDDDPIAFLNSQNVNDPYLNVWFKGMQNPRFKNYFINRFADLLNTAYLPERLSEKEQLMYNEMAKEMPKEYARWGDPNNIDQQMNAFRENHLTLNAEYRCRGQKVRNFIQNNYQFPNQVEVTLDTYPAGAGKIKISTIIPNELPWKGIYFNGNPVTITAIANPGYSFAYWDANSLLKKIDTSKTLNVDVQTNTLFKAHFIKTPFGIPNINSVDAHYLIYPNPGNGHFSIYFNDVENGIYEISIYNSVSQIIDKQTIRIDNKKGIISPLLPALGSGMYFISIRNGDIRKTLKYINLKK